MNLPNKLTVFRMVLVPVMIIALIIGQATGLKIEITTLILNIIFIVAAITDKLDGSIARKRNLVTTFGKFLDPIADKVLVITSMVILVELQRIPSWIPAIVITREFLVSGYRMIAVQKSGTVIAANIWGKLKTVTQMIAIILAFIDVNAFGAVFMNQGLSVPALVLNGAMTLMMTVCTIATIFSGWEYLKGGKDLFKGSM